MQKIVAIAFDEGCSCGKNSEKVRSLSMVFNSRKAFSESRCALEQRITYVLEGSY